MGMGSGIGIGIGSGKARANKKIESNIRGFMEANRASIVNAAGSKIALEEFLEEVIESRTAFSGDNKKIGIIVAVVLGILVLGLLGVFLFFRSRGG
ncbi:MAG: hypothetical protein GY765_34040 [bacterium]|nr:hypothetical protein [bacterium]